MIYISCYFTNLYNVHPGPCTREFVIHGRRIDRTACIIWSCACQHGPSGFWLVVFDSLCLLLCPARFSSSHLGDFFVLQGVSYNTLPLWKNIEGSSPFLRVPIACWCVWCFWRRLRSCWWIWCQFLRNLDCMICPIFLAVSNIVSGLIYLSALIWRRSCGIIVPWLPVQKRFQITQRDCFVTARDFTGSLLPVFWFHISVVKNILAVCILFYPTGFILWPYLLLLCRSGEN